MIGTGFDCGDETAIGMTDPKENTSLVADADPEQSGQWDFLTRLWPAMTILGGISAILSAIIYQYVLAIVNAAVFFLGFFCFLTSFFRYPIIALALLVFAFGGLVLNAYYVISLMTDFYECTSDGCADWRLFLFQTNYIFIVILAGVLLLACRQCWLLLVENRELAHSRLQKIKEKDF